MSKIKNFFLSLNKSTKVTMLSCGCFVLLTFVILCFFMWFPITPSDRAISSLGREGLVYNNENTESVVTTTSITIGTNTGTVTTTTTTFAHTSFIGADVTTLGSGYLSGNLIPTGTYVYEPMPMETVTTTAAPVIEDPASTTTSSDNGQQGELTTSVSDIEQPTDVTETQPTEPPTEPPVIEPTEPPVTDAPAVSPEAPAAQSE